MRSGMHGGELDSWQLNQEQSSCYLSQGGMRLAVNLMAELRMPGIELHRNSLWCQAA